MTLNASWTAPLSGIVEQKWFEKLMQNVDECYANSIVYPAKDCLFKAFEHTPFEDVKVVILGQDPYHGEAQAHGLAFSVENGIAIPPSLRHILKELKDDLGFDESKTGDLTPWAKQGVLLLNTCLSVEAGRPMSHQALGWEQFTDGVIDVLGKRKTPTVFILWGAHAQKKEKMLAGKQHLIIKSPHPSPLSAYRGFFGSQPFSKANTFLCANGRAPVDWRLQ